MTPSSEGDDVIGGWCSGWLFERLESQQFVAVVFVLFSAQGDLGGQAALQIVDQGVEAINATPAGRYALGPPPTEGVVVYSFTPSIEGASRSEGESFTPSSKGDGKTGGWCPFLHPLLRGGRCNRGVVFGVVIRGVGKSVTCRGSTRTVFGAERFRGASRSSGR